METLLAAGSPRTIDLQTVDYYLSKGYAPGPWTFVEGIRKIPPGHRLTCQIGGATNISRYFRQITRPKLSLKRPERNQQLGRLLPQAIRRRCNPDRSTAVLVSGGIDSMLILGSLVKLVGGKAEAFTFSYSDYSGPFNEEGPARKLAKHLGVRHETIPYRPLDIADGLHQILRDYGEPLAWGLHSFMLRSLTQREVGTIFTGVEPEWNIRKVDLAAIRYRKLPAVLRSVLRTGWQFAGSRVPRLAGAAAILQTERSGLPPQFLRSSIMDEDLRRAIYVNPEQARKSSQASIDLFSAALEELKEEDPYDQARLLDHRFLDADGVLYWNTAWARSYDLLVRHPYCDRDLCNFFYQLNADMPAKWHLREFAATFLPPEIAKAPRLPHTIPIGHWFRGPLREFLLDHLSPVNLRGDLFRPEAVGQLVSDHLAGKADNTWRLWALLSLVHWLNMV
jgi:asparagine synthase (glutamine-hydrolysing)